MKECVKSWLEDQMGGMDSSMVDAIYSEYRATVNRLYAELADMRTGGVAVEADVARVVHALKGSALMVGDSSLHDALVAWRNAFKLGDYASAETLWMAVEDEVKAIQ